MKIVVLDGYTLNPGDLSWNKVAQLGELTVYDRTRPEEIVGRAIDADVVLTNKCVITATVLKQLPQLKYIGELATGYNNIDVAAARKQHIIVTHIPAYSTDSVAQAVFAHLLNVINETALYAEEVRGGKWRNAKDFCYFRQPLRELSSLTLGIVGLGHIGMRVANIAHAFGMNVFAYTSKNAAQLPEGIRKTTMEGLFAVSDVLTLHCPLTMENKEMINIETLRKMRCGAILINLSRGGLICEEAVATALHEGHLRAYCADVLTEEPPKNEHILLREPHAYITPHIAWATVEARQRLLNICIKNLENFIAGQPQNEVMV